MKRIKCSKCKHTWIPRVENPKECPNCKNRDWRSTLNDTNVQK